MVIADTTCRQITLKMLPKVVTMQRTLQLMDDISVFFGCEVDRRSESDGY